MAEETKFADSFLDLSNLPSSMDELLKSSGSTNAFNKGKIVRTARWSTSVTRRKVSFPRPNFSNSTRRTSATRSTSTSKRLKTATICRS